jgi:hypothetical protein
MICHKIVERGKNNTYSGKLVLAGYRFDGYHAENFAFFQA